jgi:hypothetical protein
MSGNLHEDGDHFRQHTPAEEHEAPGGEPEPGTELAEVTPRQPGRVKTALAAASGQVRTAAAGAWHANGYMVKPLAVIPAMEGSEWLIGQVYGDWTHALAAAGVVTLLGEGVSEIANWRSHTVRPVRRRSRGAVAASGAMVAIGGAGVFNEWTALASLIVGSVVGVRVVFEERKAHRNRPAPPPVLEPVEEPPAITAGPDPRLVQFTEAFCGPGGKLDGAVASFREITNGILFELDLTATGHGTDDVAAADLVKQIAKEFSVVRGAISVDYVHEPGKHNENYCQVIITKVPLLSVTEHARPATRPWDGRGTYDWDTGCADLGWFDDGGVTHFQFNEPGSGTKHTFVFGATGSGKTGTLNVLGCEAGLAKLCRECGPARSCPSCALERVMAVWMGDGMGNGLPAWHGRADLSAAGPAGCLEMLEFAGQVAASRIEYRKAFAWTGVDPRNGEIQHNRGKGWYDVEIGHPLIVVVLDEFQKLVGHGKDVDPVMREIALGLIISALTTWRKLGLHLVLASTSADTELIGDRLIRDLLETLNIIGHRADKFSASMMGLLGDMSKLPRELPGAGLTLGYDNRNSPFATKFLREQRRPGEPLDVRTVAGDISKTPLLYDPPVQRLLAEWKIGHQHQFTVWWGRKTPAEPAPFTGLAAVPAPAPAPAGPLRTMMTQAADLAGNIRDTAEAALAAAHPAPAPAGGDLGRVLAYLAANPGPQSLGAIVTGLYQADGTRMSVADVMTAAAALHAAGQAVYADRKLQAA